MPLKTIRGGNFFPFDNIPNKTVRWTFSWPMVLTVTVFSPFIATTLLGPKLNIKGVSSILQIGAS